MHGETSRFKYISTVIPFIFSMFLSSCTTSPPPPLQASILPSAVKTAAVPKYAKMIPASYNDLPEWQNDNLDGAYGAFSRSCSALASRPEWQAICKALKTVPRHHPDKFRHYLKKWFRPYKIENASNQDTGLITGYYEPSLKGSLTPGNKYRFPVYGVPFNLIDVDLADRYPKLAGLRIRGRLKGRTLVPYYTRAQIETEPFLTNAPILCYVDNALDLFFLQIQGSGKIQLDNGKTIAIAYGDENGQPYKVLGQILANAGKISKTNINMQSILNWGKLHPNEITYYLDMNPSYVFFRLLENPSRSPEGSLGETLTAGRSIAVDNRYIPLGLPVFISSTYPYSNAPMNRLVFAQDTGGAIKGPVRADFYFGEGQAAEHNAGQMQQPGKLWLLLPKTATIYNFCHAPTCYLEKPST